MALKSGLHIFYYGQDSGTLNWLHFNGQICAEYQRPSLPDLPYLGRGPSAVLFGSRIYIFCTTNQNTVHQVAFDGTDFYDQGQLEGVSTQDETAAVVLDNAIHVFYRDRDSGALKHLSQTNGVWTNYPDVRSGIQFGPAAVVRTGHINLAFCDDNNALKVVWLANFNPGVVQDMSPSGFYLQHTPSAVLRGNDIFVLHHCNDPSRTAYGARVGPEGHWQWPEQALPNSYLHNGPAACVYGERIYCITHGGDHTLNAQILVGNAWLPVLAQMSYNGQPITNVGWGPCAVAV